MPGSSVRGFGVILCKKQWTVHSEQLAGVRICRGYPGSQRRGPGATAVVDVSGDRVEADACIVIDITGPQVRGTGGTLCVIENGSWGPGPPALYDCCPSKRPDRNSQ